MCSLYTRYYTYRYILIHVLHVCVLYATAVMNRMCGLALIDNILAEAYEHIKKRKSVSGSSCSLLWCSIRFVYSVHYNIIVCVGILVSSHTWT